VSPRLADRGGSRCLIIALLCLALAAAACGPKAAAPAAPTAPKFPDYVFPEAPMNIGSAAAQQHQQTGWEYLQAGDSRSADREFTAALKQSPDFYPAEAALGYSASAWTLRSRGEARRTWGIIGISLATMVTIQLIFCANDAFRVTRSAADLVTVLENERTPPFDPAAPVFQVGLYDQTMPFYLKRTTTLVNYRDELALGLDAEPAKGIVHEADWVPLWRSLPQAYALLGVDTFELLQRQDVPLRVVARDPRRILVARR